MSRTSDLRVVAFFGGGSGGHIYPGLAVAERAREIDPSFRAVFFRSGRRVEDEVLGASSFETLDLPLPTPVGLGASMRYAWSASRAIGEIRALLRRDFDAVIGLGGYASLPGVIAARRERIPVVLLEQNQVPGRVNRWLASWVDAISCPDARVASRFRGSPRVTGNPVRRSVVEAREVRRRRARIAGDRRRIVVVGGSQGAHGLNVAVRRALGELAPLRDRVAWWHLSGEADRDELDAAYREHGFEAEVWSFRPDLPRLLAEADLVVSRAGGTTLAEITAIGLPAILVPYPHHRDQHQFENASVLELAGAAVIVPESELDPGTLSALLSGLIADDARLDAMSRASETLGHPDAADRVLQLLRELRSP
jgi:UDP-N-acetylglucosamine--N-acetylmuramyl-(pentapeptide) pyrophosphoryl-undecaprenol N-acetylglucosamine transferase